MTTTTPGPWTAVKYTDGTASIKGERLLVASGVTHADAHLIAAAPALLEACVLVEEALSFHYHSDGLYHEAGTRPHDCSFCKAYEQATIAIAAARRDNP